MAKLYVYGDSYTALGDPPTAPWWTTAVANKLKLEQVNRAVTGSSTQTAIARFIEDGPLIQPHDTVIFQTSTSLRLHTTFQVDHPHTASQFLHAVDSTHPQYGWYKDNKDHLEWLMVNTDRRIADITQEAYVHLVRNWSELHPHVTVIVLANQWGNLQPMDHPPNFLRPPISLYEISQAEYQEGMTYQDWTRYTHWDTRTNHLSNHNARVLAEAVVEMIATGDTTTIQYNRFKRGHLPLIRSWAQYLRLVDQDVLPYFDYIGKFLP